MSQNKYFTPHMFFLFPSSIFQDYLSRHFRKNSELSFSVNLNPSASDSSTQLICWFIWSKNTKVTVKETKASKLIKNMLTKKLPFTSTLFLLKECIIIFNNFYFMCPLIYLNRSFHMNNKNINKSISDQRRLYQSYFIYISPLWVKSNPKFPILLLTMSR